MATHLPQNQFISDSAVIIPRTAGSAAASKPPPVADATAAPISDGQDVPAQMQESKARHSGLARDDEKPGDTTQESRPAHLPTGSSEIDCISEIFFYARKLIKQPPRFVLDEAAFMADVEEVRLFIREDGYLKRQA